MGRLFGTDGARGVAITELTCELAMQIGRAAAMVLTKETNHKARIPVSQATFWSLHWSQVSAQLVQTLIYSVLFLPLPLQCL